MKLAQFLRSPLWNNLVPALVRRSNVDLYLQVNPLDPRCQIYMRFTALVGYT